MVFTNKLLTHYFDRLIGRIYKILPLKESGEDSVHEYLDALLTELEGVDLVGSLSDQPYFVSIVGAVAYLREHIDSCNIKKVRRDVFGTINICKKLRDYYQGGDSDDKS